MKRSRLFPALILLLLALVVGTVLLRPGSPEQRPPSRQPAPPGISEPPSLPAPAAAAGVPTPLPETPTPSAVAPEAAPTAKVRGPHIVEVRGRVTDVNGAPQPFLKVEAFTLDGLKNAQRLETETDDKGAFKVGVPQSVRVTFTAHLPGHGRGFYSLQASDSNLYAGAVNDITLQLRAETAFDGQLMLPDGSAAAGARLRFHPVSRRYITSNEILSGMNVLNGSYPADDAWDQRCREELFLTDWTVTTDAQGQFRAQSLVAGVNYLIEVERAGRVRVLLETHVKGRKDRLVLQVPP